jgi:nicotinamide phosphoribosyltransferase
VPPESCNATILNERIFAKRTDGYKPSHWLFYEPGIIETYDYLESRGGDFRDLTFFGAQALIMKYLCGCVITPEQVNRARKFYKAYYGMDGVFNYDGWMDIATRLKGLLPIEIRALPEGTVAPVRTPMLAYRNTDPKHAWLPGYLEPLMFKIWNPTTICTLSAHCKRVLHDFLVKTGTESDIIWKLHDFGYRGVSSEESAEFAGAAHLVNFSGTDTVVAIDFINEFYGNGEFDADGDPTYMPGYSVRATEHSIMTHRGKEHEVDIVRRILRKCPDGPVVMVGDSYDIFNFARNILGGELRDEIIARNGIVGLRPDSGDPIPVMMKVMWILGEQFGWDVNHKGYRVLNHVRTVQGDKNNYDAIYNMCRAFEGAKWSLDNIATFGMGGALLQASTRDTQKMAIKLSSLTDDEGRWRDVYKDPITDPGKGSKFGRFCVTREYDAPTDKWGTVTRTLAQGEREPENNLLRVIYRNGELLVHEDFETIRKRAARENKRA